MRPRPELVLGLAIVAVLAAHAQTPDGTAAETKPAESKGARGFVPLRGWKSKGTITDASDNLKCEYKDGVIVYRGDVLAVQGDIKVRSNELRITLTKSDSPSKAAADLGDASTSKVQAIVASGSVRIDQGARWAAG